MPDFWEEFTEVDRKLNEAGVSSFELGYGIGRKIMKRIRKGELDRKNYWDEMLKEMKQKLGEFHDATEGK